MARAADSPSQLQKSVDCVSNYLRSKIDGTKKALAEIPKKIAALPGDTRDYANQIRRDGPRGIVMQPRVEADRAPIPKGERMQRFYRSLEDRFLPEDHRLSGPARFLIANIVTSVITSPISIGTYYLDKKKKAELMDLIESNYEYSDIKNDLDKNLADPTRPEKEKKKDVEKAIELAEKRQKTFFAFNQMRLRTVDQLLANPLPTFESFQKDPKVALALSDLNPLLDGRILVVAQSGQSFRFRSGVTPYSQPTKAQIQSLYRSEFVKIAVTGKVGKWFGVDGPADTSGLADDADSAAYYKSMTDGPLHFASQLQSLYAQKKITRNQFEYYLTEDVYWQTTLDHQWPKLGIERRKLKDGNPTDTALTLDDIRKETLSDLGIN